MKKIAFLYWKNIFLFHLFIQEWKLKMFFHPIRQVIEKALETMVEIISCSPSFNLQQPQVGGMFFLTQKQSYSWNMHTEELPESRTASPCMLLLCVRQLLHRYRTL